MVLAKLQLPNNKSLYLCSFYRPPNNNVTPVTKLNDFLSSVFYNESPQLPQILLAGDFNLPGSYFFNRWSNKTQPDLWN